MAIHSASLGAPILLEEGKAAGESPTVKDVATPFCDKLKATGQWNTAWDPFFELDPLWTDQFFEAVFDLYTAGFSTRSSSSCSASPATLRSRTCTRPARAVISRPLSHSARRWKRSWRCSRSRCPSVEK